MRARKRLDASSLSAALFVALVVLAVAAFAVTRAARSADDIVNTVVLSKTLKRGGSAEVAFTLADPDGSADVLIIEPTGAQVRALKRDADLRAGKQSFSWDGRDDEGKPAAPGRYALRVVLGEQGRDIRPPGRIRVVAASRGEGEGPANRGGNGGRSRNGPGKPADENKGKRRGSGARNPGDNG